MVELCSFLLEILQQTLTVIIQGTRMYVSISCTYKLNLQAVALTVSKKVHQLGRDADDCRFFTNLVIFGDGKI